MKKEITITLPLPPTDNHLYGQHGHIRYMTHEGKVWKEAAQWDIKRQYKGKVKKGDVIIKEMCFFLKRRRDIQGSLKLIFDAMEGIVYENDNQIVDFRVVKAEDKENPRVEIEISIWQKKN